MQLMLSTISFVPGDTVRVFHKVKEDEKERTQVFEGVVLQVKGRGEGKSFTVRKMVGDVTIERIWPIKTPSIEKVEIKAHAKKRVRRAKLQI